MNAGEHGMLRIQTLTLSAEPSLGLAGGLPAGSRGEPTDRTLPSGVVERLRSALPPALRARVQSASERAPALAEAEREPLATAWPAFDRLLAGGLPRGRLVELHGGRSSGRFSAVLTALAAATGIGEAAALVDLGDGLDPATAAAAGVDLARLLWLRPEGVRRALAAAEMLIGGGFPLVVIELGSPPLPGGRGAEPAWLRLARAAQAQGTALLVSSPYRVSGTAAGAVLTAGRGRAAWHGEAGGPRLLQGVSCRLALAKRRGSGAKAPDVEADAFALAASPLAPASPAPPPSPARRGRPVPRIAPERPERLLAAAV
jgi:hypothetical protein